QPVYAHFNIILTIQFYLHYITCHLIPSNYFFFFLHKTLPPNIYTLSLHDALPIYSLAPLCTSNSPATVILDGCVKLTKPLLLTKIGRPTTTLKSSRKLAAGPQLGKYLTANTYDKPMYSHIHRPPTPNQKYEQPHYP